MNNWVGAPYGKRKSNPTMERGIPGLSAAHHQTINWVHSATFPINNMTNKNFIDLLFEERINKWTYNQSLGSKHTTSSIINDESHKRSCHCLCSVSLLSVWIRVNSPVQVNCLYGQSPGTRNGVAVRADQVGHSLFHWQLWKSTHSDWSHWNIYAKQVLVLLYCKVHRVICWLDVSTDWHWPLCWQLAAFTASLPTANALTTSIEICNKNCVQFFKTKI